MNDTITTEVLRDVLRSQYHAALAMLRQAHQIGIDWVSAPHG